MDWPFFIDLGIRFWSFSGCLCFGVILLIRILHIRHQVSSWFCLLDVSRLIRLLNDTFIFSAEFLDGILGVFLNSMSLEFFDIGSIRFHINQTFVPVEYFVAFFSEFKNWRLMWLLLRFSKNLLSVDVYGRLWSTDFRKQVWARFTSILIIMVKLSIVISLLIYICILSGYQIFYVLSNSNGCIWAEILSRVSLGSISGFLIWNNMVNCWIMRIFSGRDNL